MLSCMKKENIEIRDLTTLGEGVGTILEKVTFVEGALPKEQVEVEVTEEKKNYSKALLLKIVKPSEERASPPCPYFEECGGCSVQHASKKLQESIKKTRVEESLKRIGGVENPLVEDVVSSPLAYGYRNKITLPLLDENGVKKVGFFQKRSHQIVSVEACLLHVDFADVVYGKVREILLSSSVTFYNEKKRTGELQHLVIRCSSSEKKVLVGLIGLMSPSKELKKVAKEISLIPFVKGVVHGRKERANNSIFPKTEEVLEGIGKLDEEILGVSVKISLLSFFQVNKSCAELLYKEAFALADLSPKARVLDAYSGIGSFAIYLAKRGLIVTGIESFEPAVKDAKANAKANDVRVKFVLGEVEKEMNDLKGFDCIFINPPRKGVHADVIEALCQIGPKKIIYTSCDPSTLARDVKLLGEKGYRFVKAQPFDMFPQTLHVETIASFEKNDC